MKLKKRSAWCLIYSHNGNKIPIVNVVGVFKKRKEIDLYMKRMGYDKNDKYSIHPSNLYIYEGEIKE